ncbi:MAG: hypothetical protein Fur0015_05670 [Ignavibacteriales bacterium]
MRQKKLYKAIEKIASAQYETSKDMLQEILVQIMNEATTKITGGRIWQLDPKRKGYKLLFQAGKDSKIDKNFILKIADYPIFEQITKYRTVLAKETNKILISKGIYFYSASGVGSRIKINNKYYYEYLLALNSESIDEDLRYTLNIVATILTSKIRERRISRSAQNLKEDIFKARELQKSILPEHEYNFYNYQIFGVTVPSEIIGGDFFDYLQIGFDEDRLGITVGDAASKGLSAAAEAMYISGAIRMGSFFQMKISPMMFRLNNLVNKIFSDEKFSSLFYGEISSDKKGLFLYANAGHNPPMFFSSKSKKIHYLEPTGALLGVAPNSRFETDSINFQPGDFLVIFSDGIVEAANDKFEFFGEAKLESIIHKNYNASPREIVYKILEEVQIFSTNESKYQDDKTVVVIKRLENNGTK